MGETNVRFFQYFLSRSSKSLCRGVQYLKPKAAVLYTILTYPALSLQQFTYAEQLTGDVLSLIRSEKLSNTTTTRLTNNGNLLLTVSQLAIFTHSHRLLLDIILCEQTRLSRHYLHDGSWDHHVLDSVVALPRLPSLWRNHLRKDNI